MNTLKINGTTLTGIYVDAAVSYNKPAKNVTNYRIPGRNGSLVVDEGTFDNVLISYPVYEKDTFPTEFDQLVNYLASLEGYQRIECSNDPGHFRLGRFVVPEAPTAKRLNRDGFYTLTFDCKPQRFTTAGEATTVINANPSETYTGAIASFDATAQDTISDLSVAITPVQSGSGDPYPAGGGVNIYPDCAISGSQNSVTVTQNGSAYALSGTASAYTQFISSDTITLAAGTYMLSCFNSANGIYVQLRSTDGLTTYQSAGYGNPSTESQSFTLSETTTLKARILVQSVATNRTIYIEVSKGSTAPSAWTPYSNIRPITGWSGANVVRTGKNLFDKNAVAMGKWLSTSTGLEESQAGYDVSDYIPVRANQPVFIPASGTSRRWFYDSTKTPKTYLNFSNDQVFTPTENGYIRVTILIIGTGAKDLDTYQIEYGSSATTYEPFGTTYLTDWTSEAGTVYGGTLNVKTGMLTVTDKYFSLTTALLYGDYGGHPLYYVEIPDYATEPIQRVSSTSQKYGTIISNYFKEISESTAAAMASGEFRTDGANPPTRFYFRYDEAADLASINTMFASTPMQVVATLATPTTVQLTPTEVKTLLGVNNIWADTGDVTVEVTSGTLFNNPSLFNAKPLIRAYGIGTFRVNDNVVTIANHDKPYIDIDCELQECYYEGDNMSSYVSFSDNDYPELVPGDNYVLMVGVTKLDVTPRWWIL